ncbi:hypothetical protein H0V99_02140 [Candidatus Saccharibacteria bacterium]|nr:hypothetical protein [Candidatus Saccharibacteria bacterium]
MIYQPIVVTPEGLVMVPENVMRRPEDDFIEQVADRIRQVGSTAGEFINNQAKPRSGFLARFGLATVLTVGAIGTESFDANQTSVLEKRKDKTEQTIRFKGPRSKLPYVAAGGVAAGVYAIGGIFSKWPFPWKINVPSLPAINEKSPPEVVVGIDPESYEIEDEFELYCNSRISVAVGVKGRQHNSILGDGTLNDKKFGDFLLCADNGKLRFRITPEFDEYGNVISVSGVLPPLLVTQPRVDHEDVRNCIDAKSDTSMEKIQELVAKRKAEIAEGKHPKCDNGFDVDGFLPAPDESSTIIDLSYTAAQIAIALDANPNIPVYPTESTVDASTVAEREGGETLTIIEREYARYEKKVRDELMFYYQLPANMIHLTRTDLKETLETRTAKVYEEIKSEGLFTKFELSEDGSQLVMWGPDDSKVTVNYTNEIVVEDIVEPSVEHVGN